MLTNNAEKITAWRAENPTTRITKLTLLDMLEVDTLRDADLWGANLWGANLRGANLRGANLRGANLWGGLPIQAGKSGSGAMVPTPAGWRITIDCWRNKTLAGLADLIEDRAEWPEARGEERERRRPMLRAVLALCEAHIAQQPVDIIEKLAEKWKEQ